MSDLPSAAAPATRLPGGMHRTVALCLLTFVGTLSFVDRQILAVLIEPIRADMQFTDTQFGLLTGLAFAIFYTAMGVPMAMIADRWSRVRLIAICCFVWSVFTAASGVATTFVHLALARFGVGVGESGGTAPSLSILADYYPPEKRPMVISIFTASGPAGVFIGAAFGSWVALNLDWRWAFYILGIIGIITAPLLWSAVREPARGMMDGAAAATKTGSAAAMPLGDCLKLFLQRRSLLLLLIASGLAAFVSYGMLNWIPAYLMRTQGMPMTAMATWFAPAAGGSMLVGMLSGGTLVNMAVHKTKRAYALIPMIAAIILVPTFGAALMVDNWKTALLLMIIPMIACTVYVPPALALVANLTPPRARATCSAFLLLVLNLVGLAGGPLFVGIVSDYMAPSVGTESLRIALLCLLPFGVLVVLFQFLASRHVVADMEAARAEDATRV
jgi:MFS family permease